MRIISGHLGGRRLSPPLKKWPTRPTTDRAREALFNILENKINWSESTILELFGGTGAHAFECISRGCNDVTYVDKHHGCVDFVRNQSAEFGVSDSIKIIKNDVRRFIMSAPSTEYTYVFADPPYALKWMADLPDLIYNYLNLSAISLVILEHDSRNNFKFHPHFSEDRKYGDTVFSFFDGS